MNLEEILKQVDEIEKIASDPNYMPDPGIDEVTGLDFARSVRSLVERVREAEELSECKCVGSASVKWALCGKCKYREKWGSK